MGVDVVWIMCIMVMEGKKKKGKRGRDEGRGQGEMEKKIIRQRRKEGRERERERGIRREREREERGCTSKLREMGGLAPCFCFAVSVMGSSSTSALNCVSLSPCMCRILQRKQTKLSSITISNHIHTHNMYVYT